VQSDDDRNTPRLSNSPSNIFVREFLDHIGRRKEPPAATEAAVAGPWHIEEVHSVFYAVYRSGESFARGHRPWAVFTNPTHALLIAALLPGTGRDPLFHLQKEVGPSGYAIEAGGEAIGHLAVFDDKLVDALHAIECLLRSPEALANLLEAAGGVVLERAGAVLVGRVGEE
jgi:hypothetical protein